MAQPNNTLTHEAQARSAGGYFTVIFISLGFAAVVYQFINGDAPIFVFIGIGLVWLVAVYIIFANANGKAEYHDDGITITNNGKTTDIPANEIEAIERLPKRNGGLTRYWIRKKNGESVMINAALRPGDIKFEDALKAMGYDVKYLANTPKS